MRISLARLVCSLVASSSVVWSLVGCAPPNEAKPYPPAGAAADAPTPKVEEPASEPAAKPTGLVRYFDREIDLQPFLAGFPFGRWHPSLRTDRMFYFTIGDAYGLRMIEPAPGKSWDLAHGKAIGDIDWSKRSLWSIHHHAPSNSLWLHADASNDEKMNLWKMSLTDGAIEQVTNHDYVYGLGFSPDEKSIAYLPRAGKQAPFRTCLRLRDVASGDEREVVCDTPALTFTWSEIRFAPDGSAAYFTAQVSGDRNRVQLVRVDLLAKAPKVETLTNPRARRSDLTLLEVDSPDALVFVANDDGFANLHSYSRKTKRSRQLTKFTEDVTSAHRVDDGVVAVHRTPAGSTLVLVDPTSGTVLDRKSVV